MRKLVLIAGLVLASAAAQATDRSLSVVGGDVLTAAVPTKVAETQKTAEAPQVAATQATEAPKPRHPRRHSRIPNRQSRLRRRWRQRRKPKSPGARVTGPKGASSASCIGTASIGNSQNDNARGSKSAGAIDSLNTVDSRLSIPSPEPSAPRCRSGGSQRSAPSNP